MRRRHRSEERHESRYHQGIWTFESSPESPEQRGLQVRRRRVSNTAFFHLILKQNVYRRARCPKMIAKVEATSWHLRECIRARELVATHRLGRMRRLRMIEKQKAWKRETGFGRIEIIAEIREEHLPAGVDSEPLYTKLYNPRWPHSPEERKLDMGVEIKRLRLGLLLSFAAWTIAAR